MIRLKCILVATVAAMLTGPAIAADIKAGALQISTPWARATPKGATIGAGYMTITNTGTTSDRLMGGVTPVSDKFEIHEMSMDNGVMKMRPRSGGLEIKPGQTVTLNPGGLHVMFVGLKAPLTQGQTFQVTLEFEKTGKVDVDYPVTAIGARAGGDSTPGNMPATGGMKH